MDGRRARLIAPVLDSLPRLTRSAAEPRQQVGRLRTGWAIVLGAGWPLAFLVGVALEPAPAHHEAVPPLLVQLASDVFLIALLTTVVTAVRRLPTAAWAGAGAGLVGMTLSVACPFSGHHNFGLWWIGQLAVMATMLAVSVTALGRRSRTST